MIAARTNVDVAVVGAGILGLAVARELTRRLPGSRISVLDKEPDVAAHQSSHNSGVIHAGIYYAPGSLKAKLCVEGAAAIYEYCDRRGITYERCGKVIVAVDEHERVGLEELERRGNANGVPGLKMVGAAELRDREPHVRGVAALVSPATGIVDFGAVARSLADDVRAAGGEIVTGCEVRGVVERGRDVELAHRGGATLARHAVFCCGAWSDVLAVRAGAPAEPRIVPFRGSYMRLRAERTELVRGLVYPVPDPRLPFLGVHLTRHIDGGVLVGPTALVAGARLWRTLFWPGSWRLGARFWRTGASELRMAASRRAFVAAAARYVPELRVADVEPAFAGVRAQALSRSGRLVDDFVFSATRRTLHVRNAPSPGATSSLVIAHLIAERAAGQFELDLHAQRPE
ncbi:MAG: L-2-hydroxyglutarate oxidase [Dehalococcoidia bacterium]